MKDIAFMPFSVVLPYSPKPNMFYSNIFIE